MDEKIRIDKWLWAARFFRTRALAQQAVTGGRVHIDGERVKPSRNVMPGDRLEVTRGEQRLEVIVVDVSDKRGPAQVAGTLYEETEDSRRRREDNAAMRKVLRQSDPRPDRRPDKKQRRNIIRFKEKR